MGKSKTKTGPKMSHLASRARAEQAVVLRARARAERMRQMHRRTELGERIGGPVRQRRWLILRPLDVKRSQG